MSSRCVVVLLFQIKDFQQYLRFTGSPSSLSFIDPVAALNKDIYELEFCATVDQRITWLGSEIGLLVGIVIE
jgi:hypothetical protein